MKGFSANGRYAGLFVCAWLGVNLLILPRFPTVYIDEAENANHAYNLAFHHEAVFSLYDGLYPPPLYELRHAWPVVIRPFYCHPLARWIQLVGFSLVKARLFSLGAAGLALLTVYGIGCLLGNPRWGFLAMGLLSTRFAFLYTADRIRPEMWLALFGLLAFASLVMSLRSSNPWFAGLAGAIAGLSVGIHTNGVALILPVIALLLFEKKWPALGLAVLGWLAGFSGFVLSADWSRFLPGVPTLFFQEFSSPSILKFHGNIFAALGSEWERYVGGWDFHDWTGGRFFHMVNGWQYALYVGAVAWGCLRKGPLRWPAQFAAVLALGYALLVGQKAFPYLAVLEPYFALSLGLWLLSTPLPPLKTLIAPLALLLIALPLGKLPLLWVAALWILPKKKFQWTLFVFALCLLMRAPDVPGWLRTLLSDIRSYGAMMALGAALWIAARLWTKGPSPAPSWGHTSWTLTGATTVATLLFVGSITAYRPSFNTLCEGLASQIPPGSRIAGPQNFWVGLSAYPYHDIGGLIWYRLLTGEKNLVRPLENLKPDYMIVSSQLADQIARLNHQRNAQGLQGPTHLFPWAHQVLQVVDAGPVYGRKLALIRNLWNVPLSDQ